MRSASGGHQARRSLYPAANSAPISAVLYESPDRLPHSINCSWLIFCGTPFGPDWGPKAGTRGASIMMTLVRSPQTLRANLVLFSWALGALLVVPAAAVNGQPAKVDVLRIGSTGSLG